MNDVPDTVGAANIIILTTFEGRKVAFSLVVEVKIYYGQHLSLINDIFPVP